MTQIIVERYRLDQHLVSINHSEFYNGFDLEKEQPVIVRVIDLTQGDQKDQDKLQGFVENETRLMQQLDHPLVLKVLDYGIEGTTYYHINEFLSFNTLRNVITQHPCDLRTALEYGRDLAAVLAQIHAMNLIHCDLKPDNILLGEEADLALLNDSSARFAFPFVSEPSYFFTNFTGFSCLNSLVY